jgi:hypothetical protein
MFRNEWRIVFPVFERTISICFDMKRVVMCVIVEIETSVLGGLWRSKYMGRREFSWLVTFHLQQQQQHEALIQI